jgi:hypothetical protein
LFAVTVVQFSYFHAKQTLRASEDRGDFMQSLQKHCGLFEVRLSSASGCKRSLDSFLQWRLPGLVRLLGAALVVYLAALQHLSPKQTFTAE